MPRAVSGLVKAKRRKKIMERAKGFVGGKRRLYRTAKTTVMRALAYSYRDRKVKKRDFRALWITRLSAALRERGYNYSQFIAGLKKANIVLNRKALSNMAIEDAEAFSKVVEIAMASK